MFSYLFTMHKTTLTTFGTRQNLMKLELLKVYLDKENITAVNKQAKGMRSNNQPDACLNITRRGSF